MKYALFFAFLFLVGCTITGQEQAEDVEKPLVQNVNEIPPDITPPSKQPSPLELANMSAYAFVFSSSTYSYDGFGLKLDNYSELADNFTFTYKFTSQYSGFGNRSSYYLQKLNTPHTLIIMVSGKEVKSAILDGVYDEIDKKLLDVAKTFDPTPIPLEKCKQIALDFVNKTSSNLYPGLSPWIGTYATTQISDTLCYVIVTVPTTADGKTTEMVPVFVDHTDPFIPNPISQRSWIDIYLDPNADLSQIIHPIPDPLCPPGQLIAISPYKKFCYFPTKTNGLPCSSTASCEKGACVRTSSGEFGTPTKCFDYPYGCRYWVAENNQPAKLVCLT